jgi:hypothetical protein
MPTPTSLLLIAVAAGALFLAVGLLAMALRRTRARKTTARVTLVPALEGDGIGGIDPIDVAFSDLLKAEEVCAESGGPRSLLVEFFNDKACVLCGQELSVEPGQHRRALLSPEGMTLEWADLRVEEIPDVRDTHQPLCWDCHVIETLHRMHSGHVTEREPHKPSHK